jgi:hypothetical protein
MHERSYTVVLDLPGFDYFVGETVIAAKNPTSTTVKRLANMFSGVQSSASFHLSRTRPLMGAVACVNLLHTIVGNLLQTIVVWRHAFSRSFQCTCWYAMFAGPAIVHSQTRCFSHIDNAINVVQLVTSFELL